MNLVDNNFIWNINGQGVRVADTDNTIIAHNLFANVSEELVVAKVATDRSLGGRRLTSKGNRIVNNLIVDQGKQIITDDPSNLADYNVYISTNTDKKAAKDTGEHSLAINGEMSFDDDNQLLFWKSKSTLPNVPLVKSCESDFFGRGRTTVQNVPGPFMGIGNPVTLKLNK